MRSTLLVFAFLLSSISVLAQDNSVEYMDNTLIIKFKSAQEAEKYKAKSIPEASIFTQHNIGEMKSIWKDEFSSRIEANMRSKGKVASLPSFDHLKNIYNVGYTSNIDVLTLAQKISTLPGVEYAEPQFIYKTSLNTSDPIRNDFVTFHNFNRAWDVSTSSSDVIISIVDSGVNYNHEDLVGKQWFNEDEIPNNGIDDDNNGFIDDYLGWDFHDNGTFSSGNIVQDNDPFANNSAHGTHVAGISTATPDNEIGLVGAGFNARYMAVKAGGPPDDPSTEGDETRSIGFGYQGILYSVLNGADIINCSWGGTGFSSFGEDVVNMATDAGALVIAAAGNSGSQQDHYPSGYENVLSVGALGATNSIADYSNYGYTVDVFAKGTINSTVGTGSETNQYSTFQGTSMASPVVSGLAALLKSANPDWTPFQIKLQIRSTAISIEVSNDESFKFKLGSGKIDAFRALEGVLPGINIDSVAFLNSNEETLGLNEEGILRLFITNYGGATSSLQFEIQSFTNYINIIDNSNNAGYIEKNQSSVVDFPITLKDNILESLRDQLLISFRDNGLNYSDFDIIEYNQLQYDISNANNLAMSFSPTGHIGFYDASNSSGGIGFIPNHRTADFGSDNLLYEGGLIFEVNKLLASAGRSTADFPDRDFEPVDFISFKSPGIISDADGTTSFKPKSKTGIRGAEINLNTFAFSENELSNSILLKYSIKNTSKTLSLSDLYLGIYNDWDIGNFSNNSAYYNEENDILFLKEEESTTHPLVALATFANTSSVLAIDNNYSHEESDFRFGVNDGFTRSEKFNSLKAGTSNTDVRNADISAVVASGPYYVSPGDSISIGFIYAFGNSEQDLFEQINAARTSGIFEVNEINSDPDNSFPSSTSLFQNFPNPFNPTTNITFNLSQISDVELSIYDLLGKKVRTIVSDRLTGGIHNYSVSLNELSSGIYFAILETPNFKELIKLTLIK